MTQDASIIPGGGRDIGMSVAILGAFVVAITACGPSTATDDANGVGGDGRGGDGGGSAGGPDGPDECGDLVASMRDFREDHPDFEGAIADDRGLVQAILGGDGKPVYAPPGATATVSGPPSFNQWYNDVPGVNMLFAVPITLTEIAPGRFVFEDLDFFPLDGMGWPGEEIDGHNFHFTTELHGAFRYRGGETFTFTGDDDLFAFVNGHLAIDLGGVHGVQGHTIDFDASAATLGITPGNVYSLDVFHAERHTGESNFRIETSIECIVTEIE
jgi:fibro-slime domain-containing protein